MATITPVVALPDNAGVLTAANLAQLNANVALQNTNEANLNAAIAAIIAGGFAATDGLTAHAGGTQAAALQLTTVVNRVSTVATAADSVKLPLAVAGAICVVINDAAKSLQVFGAGTDTINDVATATGIPLAGTSMAVFFCSTVAPAGKWYSLGQWVLQATKAVITTSGTIAQDWNYIATESGGNNALVAALLDASGNAVTVAAGLRVSIKLAHSLQAGANTFNLNSHGTDSIKKTSNPATDLSVTAVSGSILTMIFDGTVWQVQGA